MKERRLSREVVMQVLFLWESQGLISSTNVTEPLALPNVEMDIFLGQFLHNFYMKDKSKLDSGFITNLISGTLGSLVKIDSLIEKHSNKWRLSRMQAIDRAIIRMACYELAVKKTLSARVIINEAVEIAKRYGSEQSPSFINGVLDTIKENTLSQ